jgi:hypothetical protein
MVKLNTYTRKQPEASNDYTTAHQLVNTLAPGQSQTAEVDNIKVFRKYIYDLSYKLGRTFATRLTAGRLTVTRLT